MSTIDVGISLPTMSELSPNGFPGVAEGARLVEGAGLDSVSASDFIMGNGVPALDAGTVLAVTAGVTERVLLRFGVMVLPLRTVAWTAAQVGTLQQLSGNRVVLGVGTGGAPGTPFWDAVGASAKGRSARLEAALEVLPGLLAGRETALGDAGTPVTLAPATEVPPVLVGGNSERAIRRAARYGDGWLPSMLSPARLADGVRLLHKVAAEHGRPTPSVTLWTHASLGDDESVREARAAFERSLVESFGVSPEDAPDVPISGSPEQAAERLAEFAEAGADHIDLVPDGGRWTDQVELIGRARALAG